MFWQPRPPCSLRLVRSQSKKGRDRGGIPPGVPDMAWSRRETWPDIEREEVTIRHYRCVHCAAILVGREVLWSNVTQPSLTPARPTGWAHLKWAPLSHGAHVTAEEEEAAAELAKLEQLVRAHDAAPRSRRSITFPTHASPSPSGVFVNLRAPICL